MSEDVTLNSRWFNNFEAVKLLIIVNLIVTE